MNVKEIRCPSCSAPLNVNEESDYIVCEYCGITSLVEHPESGTVLRAVDEVADTIRETGDKTEEAIRASSTALSGRLSTLETHNELMSLRLQLLTLNSEIDALHQRKSSRKVKGQLRDLYGRRLLVEERIAGLERHLNPQIAKRTPVRSRPSILQGCLGLIVLFFVTGFLLSMCSSTEQSVDRAATEAPGDVAIDSDESVDALPDPTPEDDGVDADSEPTGGSEAFESLPTEVPQPTAIQALELPSPTFVTEEQVSATVLRNANVRTGPGTDFEVAEIASAGEILQVYGRTTNGWLQVSSRGDRWIGTSVVRVEGVLTNVPLIAPTDP